MMKKDHNSFVSRTAIALLITIGAIVLLTGTAAANDPGCEDACESPLLYEVHVPDTTINPELCEPPVPAFCLCPRLACEEALVSFYDHSSGYIDTWEWDFGDPASGADNYATGEYPTHYYSAPGSYTVTLTVTGCGGTEKKVYKDCVVIKTAPTADFTADPTQGCQPLTVQFTNLSTDAIDWRWDFGDGSISFEENPSHTYTNPGVYTVTLRARNECGKDYETKEEYITVGVGPTADFSADPTELCVGADVTFTDLSTGATTWLWDFGDGVSSTARNPVHAYRTAGTYTVSLTVSNACGDDTETKDQLITVLPGPTADFSASSTTLCDNGDVTFTDLSTGALTWLWDFGDGSATSADQNPVHSYAAPGVYTVSLTVTNDCGEDTETKQAYITVTPPPTADFESNTTVACVGSPVIFTDLSQHATTWTWDFGDGTTSNVPSPTHTYTAEGTYTVSLHVSNPCGEDDEVKTEYIRVVYGPEADFTANKTEVCIEETVTFTDLSSHALTWSWNFGDGHTSTDQNPTHAYGAAGIYTVSLTVTNDCGDDTETKAAYITVLGTPTADFDFDTEPECEEAPVEFTDMSTSATHWSWSFGDGTSSTDRNPIHFYSSSGDFTVTLLVWNDCGDDSDTKTATVTILPKPIADYHAIPTEGCVGMPIAFYNDSQYADFYDWDFGDGGTSTAVNPSHTYSAPGLYTVTLTASGTCGSDVERRVNYIYIHEDPAADFTADRTEVCVESAVQFTDLSPDARSWDWDFGDGSTSDEQNPLHMYFMTGVYTVSLTIDNGCGDDTETKTQYIRVLPPPIADFEADKTEACVEEEIQFTDLSSDAADWEWDFGDGTTSTDQNPIHFYSAPGTYDVELTVTNDCGYDIEAKTEYIRILSGPTADFEATPEEGCVELTVQFTDLSTNATLLYWEFGDGTNSHSQNPSHTYSSPGIYTVTLTAQNSCGTDEATKTDFIHVDYPPVADFTADDTEICAGETVNFTDQSTYARTWSWNFGDGGTSPSQNPSHVYTTAGLFTVTLTVSNACGDDKEEKTEYVLVHPAPTADFYADPTEGCTETEVSFTSTSAYADTWSWDFGDGGTSDLENPSHTYLTPGVYTVSLTVTNDCGEDTETKDQYIRIDDPPVAAFTADPTELCTKTDVHFTDLSTNATSWLWNFGDGTSSLTQNPTHSYTVAGTYTVTLTVANSCGQDDETKTDLIVVHGGPTADFSASATSGYIPLTVDFTDLSTSDLTITSWEWSFGDGATTTTQHPTHTYTAAGLYTVELTVTDECDSDTETKTEYIYVSEECIVDFIAEPTHVCEGGTVYFGGTTEGACNVTTWTWDFGDPNSGNDNTATGRDVEHIYNEAGTYTVTLTAAEAQGTQVVKKDNFVVVQSGPTASFNADPQSGSAPLFVNFTDQTVSTAGGLSRLWDFGDPSSGSSNTSTLQNPYHTYGGEGTYTVTLIATDDCGADTAETVIEVGPALTISKIVDKVVAPVGDELTYTMTILNNADVTINNIMVVDTVPDSTSYVTGSASGGGAYDAQTDLMNWTIPSIAPGASTSVSFRVVLDGPFFRFPTVVANIATATFDDGGIATALRTFVSNEVETVVDQATGVLSVTKAVSASLASPGDRLTYTITVENNSPSPAMNLTIRDAVPDLTEFVNGSIVGAGVHYPSNDSLLWGLGTLNGFQSVSVAFDVTIDGDCDDGTIIPNTALATSTLGGDISNEVITEVSRVPMVIRKTTSTPSGMFGDMLKFSITVENFSSLPLDDMTIRDTMPVGLLYVDGSSRRDGGRIADPIGSLPVLEWQVGDLAPNSSLKLDYTALVGSSAEPGLHQNVARAHAMQTGLAISSNRATADIYIHSYVLNGAIRGNVIVDCDGDGVADMEPPPHGMDVYLDDGSQSRVNESGIFFFSTVRPGERVVALDERDLDGFYIPEDAQSSVFVHVHETGESYVTFRVCPDYPHLDIEKQAAIIPKVKVTKRATVDQKLTEESPGVVIDYHIDVESNGRTEPVPVRVVDSLPASIEMVGDTAVAEMRREGDKLVYEVSAAREKLRESLDYKLRDLNPGDRQFLSNTIYAEGELAPLGEEPHLINSEPVSVDAGPLVLAPPADLKITLTPALFVTSKAFLQPPAIPQLHAVADSIIKYADADVKVNGHTDFRPIHTQEFPSNWELGEARAKAVVDWLVENRGIDPDRMVYESFAATVPVVVDVPRTSEALQPNRRTEVIIQGRATGGAIDMATVPTEGWAKSTELALDPVDFGDTFELADASGMVGLDDSWEVRLTVVNTSDMAAENALLTDVLPEGVEFIEESARVNGVPTMVTVDGNKLSLKIARIDPKQQLVIGYRVRLLDGAMPTGGGAASVEVTSTTGLPVIQTSNEIGFE